MLTHIRIVLAMSVFSVWPALCGAQAIDSGTMQLGGLANVIATSPGFSSVDLGAEATFYLWRVVGIGGVFSLQHFSIDGPGAASGARLSSTYYGPALRARLPLDNASVFVLMGSIGGIQTSIVNENTGVGPNLNLRALGRYWMAGAGPSFALSSHTSLDLGVRYQSSTFTFLGGEAGRLTAAGLILAAGFSLYLH